MAVNHFLRERFPSKTWTSIAVLYNPSMPLHRDILNMIGHANHAVALGNFLEGRVWIEDENGQATTVLETKKDRSCFMVRGSTCMMLQLRSMLGNIICWKSIAETCGLLQHIRLKRSSMLLLRTSTSLSNLAFQFLSYSKHSNCVNPSMSKPLRAHSGMSFDFVAGRFHDGSTIRATSSHSPVFG